MKGVIIAIGIVLILTFPIVVKGRTFIDFKTQKIYFSFYFLGLILFLRGAIKLKKDKAEVQIWKFKFERPYKQAFNGKKTVELIKGINLFNVSALLEVGVENTLKGVCIGGAYNVLFNLLVCVLKCFNPLLIAKNRVYLYEEEGCLKYNLNVTFQFCLLNVITIFSKKLIRKFV